MGKNATICRRVGASFLTLALCAIILACGKQERMADTTLTQHASPTASAGLPAPVGAWQDIGKLIVWRTDDIFPKPEPHGAAILLRAAPSGGIVAVRDRQGRLVVRGTSNDGQLGGELWDTKGLGFAVNEMAWAGTRLVFWRIDGVTDLTKLYHEDPLTGWGPYGNPFEYNKSHSQTWTWSLQDRTLRPLVTRGSGYLSADAPGTTLMLWNPTFTKATELSEAGPMVSVYSLPEGDELSGRRALLGRALPFSVGGGTSWPLPILGNDHQVCPVMGTEEGPAYPGSTRTTAVPALMLVGMDGGLVECSDTTEHRVDETPVGFPAAVRLPHGGEAVACWLRAWGAFPWRLAFYDLRGELIRTHSFGLRYGVVEKATGLKTDWLPVTVTPDGRHLLLHESGRREGEPEKRPWLWLWDLEKETAQPVARVPRIEAVFGWVREEYLMLRLDVADSAESQGVVHVPWKSVAMAVSTSVRPRSSAPVHDELSVPRLAGVSSLRR